jgi:hypothetical protein
MEFSDETGTPDRRGASWPYRLTGGFRDDPQARRTDPAFAQMRAYWEALRAARSVPLRAEINPRGLEAGLDRAFMLERVARTVARVRLAGSHATALMGMEVRGMPLSALIVPDARDQMGAALAEVFDGPAIAELILDAPRSLGRPPLSGRMLILPLTSDTGEIDRALGCLSAEGVIGRTPRRFDITMTRLTRLGAGAARDKAAPAAFTLPDPAIDARGAPGLADPGAAYDGPPRPDRPHLRLVKTDREG